VENLVSHYVKFDKATSRLRERYYWKFISYLSSKQQTVALLILLPQYTENDIFRIVCEIL